MLHHPSLLNEAQVTHDLVVLQRKQREVAKENEFYYELLVQSLPVEQQEAYHLRNSASQVRSLVSCPVCIFGLS